MMQMALQGQGEHKEKQVYNRTSSLVWEENGASKGFGVGQVEFGSVQTQSLSGFVTQTLQVQSVSFHTKGSAHTQ